MQARRFHLFWLFCGLFVSGLSRRAFAQPIPPTTGDVVVQLQMNASIAQFLSNYGVSIKAVDATPNTYVLSSNIKLDPKTMVALMSADPRVVVAEPNYITCAAELVAKSVPQWTSVFDGDGGLSFYTGQYAVTQVNYNLTPQMADGSNTLVAVLDTGISLRPALLASRTVSGWNFVDGNSDTDDRPYNLDVDGDGMPDEAVGHGTMIAGLVARFAPRATLLPVRVLNSEGYGTLAKVVDGVNYAVARGAKVINLSFGFSQNSKMLTTALDNARRKGVLVVAAAGNANSTLLYMPAGCPGVLTVAGVDANNQKASFSNYGKAISVCAPAVNITSTYWDGRYASWSGTSFASPMVAAEAALLFSYKPTATPDAVRNAILESSHNLNPWNPLYLNLLGGKDAGLIDFDNAFGEL